MSDMAKIDLAKNDLAENDLLKSVPVKNDPLTIAGRQFHSRLIVGTGKYRSFQETASALEASGAEMVTVAVRRVGLDRSKESLLDYVSPEKYFLLPNTAGCYTAEEAIRTARLGREVGLSDWVKIEVIGDPDTLYPDVQATIEATRVLVKEGFIVLPYTSDDIVVAKRLLDAGASAIMPLGAPIGSGMGIQNEANLRILREKLSVPLIVDAGVGTADGGGHEERRYCRTAGVAGRKDAEKALCYRQLSGGRRGPLARLTASGRRYCRKLPRDLRRGTSGLPRPAWHSVTVREPRAQLPRDST
jgi:thiazole synthase